MPSPFPGMDPYLEGYLWTTLHNALPIEIIRHLAPHLHPRYLALPAERHVPEVVDDAATTSASIYPDVAVVELAHGPDRRTATMVRPAAMRPPTPVAIPHVSVEIRDRAERRLVTAIEILSPTNKRGEGREEYRARRTQILRSTAHLLEIDLLRRGERVTLIGELPSAPYFVFLGRSETRPWTDIWPIQANEPLPVVPVPLLPGDADAPLDLQAAFAGVYDLLRYDLAIDYTRPPDLALEGDAAARADQVLREVGCKVSCVI